MALAELVALCKLQQIGDSFYLLLPANLKQRLGIEKGTEFEVHYDTRKEVITYKRRGTA